VSIRGWFQFGWGLDSRRACLGVWDVRFVGAMRYLTLLALVSILSPGVCFGETVSGQHPEEFRGTVTRSVQMKYLLFIPDGYGDNQSKKWPLIMYLHGGSRRGDEVEKVREPGWGLPALLEKKKLFPLFPFIVVSPLCPNGEFWTDTEALIALLDDVEKHYSVDLARIYLTGHSMGGFGTWYLAYQHPERFAAIAPMSAPFVVTAWADRLKKMPIWAFHGSDDNLVPISRTQDLIDALRASGNNVRFTVLPGRDHGILDTYENKELYSWFLEHARSEKDTANGHEEKAANGRE
jgi:predicted peptidase